MMGQTDEGEMEEDVAHIAMNVEKKDQQQSKTELYPRAGQHPSICPLVSVLFNPEIFHWTKEGPNKEAKEEQKSLCDVW